MNDYERQRRLAETSRLLDACGGILPSARRNLLRTLPGWPKAACYETDRSTGHAVAEDDEGKNFSTVSDPTGELASDLADSGHHPGQHDLELIDDLVSLLLRKARELDKVLAKATPRIKAQPKPEDDDRLDVDPGCEVVAQIRRDNGQPHYEPTYVESSTVKGNLQRPHRLGEWAYKFVLRTGRLPTKAETEAHLRGERIRVKAS